MTKWEEKIIKDCNKIIEKNNFSKLKFDSWLTSRILGSFLILIAGITIMIGALFFITGFNYILASISVTVSVLMTIIAGLIFKLRTKITEIKAKIIAKLDFSLYYALAFKELSSNKYQFTSLSTFFDVFPINFLPKNGTITVDSVLNFSCAGINFSYGTITNEISTFIIPPKANRIEMNSYARFCYLNLNLIQSTNLNTIIQQSSHSFLRSSKVLDDTVLESPEFQRIYCVETDDQIMIRKVLKPKVLENLVKLAYDCENIPKIAILNQQITFAFDSFKVSGLDDPKGKMQEVNFKGKTDNMAQIICHKIKSDLDFLFYALTWADTFEFTKK